MSNQYQKLITEAYAAFNTRDINKVLLLLHHDVHWPNGWEGGYVNGHNEVKDYWTRQWKEIDPNVQPVAFKEKKDGQIEVEVHSVVKDLSGNILSDGIIKHVYTIEDDLIRTMKIEKQ